MNEIEESIGVVRDYVISLEERVEQAIREKNQLVKKVSLKTNEIRALKEELKRWENSLERLIKNA